MTEKQILGLALLIFFIVVYFYFCGRSNGRLYQKQIDELTPVDDGFHPRFIAGFKAGHKKGRDRRKGDKKYASFGRIAMKYVDRAGDVHPGIDDAEKICAEFHKELMDEIERWLPKEMKNKKPAIEPIISEGPFQFVFQIWFNDTTDGKNVSVLLGHSAGSNFQEACENLYESQFPELRQHWNVEKTKFKGSLLSQHRPMQCKSE